MENPLRVQAKVNELNLAEPRPLGTVLGTTNVPNVWASVPGYFALTGFSNANGVNVFNANTGYIVKIFVKSTTGEMRIYPFQFFENT